jgi:hypothetical protein
MRICLTKDQIADVLTNKPVHVPVLHSDGRRVMLGFDAVEVTLAPGTAANFVFHNRVNCDNLCTHPGCPCSCHLEIKAQKALKHPQDEEPSDGGVGGIIQGWK